MSTKIESAEAEKLQFRRDIQTLQNDKKNFDQKIYEHRNNYKEAVKRADNLESKKSQLQEGIKNTEENIKSWEKNIQRGLMSGYTTANQDRTAHDVRNVRHVSADEQRRANEAEQMLLSK